MQTEEQIQNYGNEYWTTLGIGRSLTHTAKVILDTIQDRGYIAGSYAAWLTTHDLCIIHPTPGDIDIFATSADEAKAIAADLCKALDGYSIVSESDVAYTLECAPHKAIFRESKDIQVVKPNPEWKEFPQDIIRSFDFDVCRAAVLNKHHVLADINAGTMEAKILSINNPVRSLKRVLKYYKRGITFPDHELIKLFQAWDATSPERRAALIDLAGPPLPEYDPGAIRHEPYDWIEDEYFDGE